MMPIETHMVAALATMRKATLVGKSDCNSPNRSHSIASGCSTAFTMFSRKTRQMYSKIIFMATNMLLRPNTALRISDGKPTNTINVFLSKLIGVERNSLGPIYLLSYLADIILEVAGRRFGDLLHDGVHLGENIGWDCASNLRAIEGDRLCSRESDYAPDLVLGKAPVEKTIVLLKDGVRGVTVKPFV